MYKSLCVHKLSCFYVFINWVSISLWPEYLCAIVVICSTTSDIRRKMANQLFVYLKQGVVVGVALLLHDLNNTKFTLFY